VSYLDSAGVHLIFKLARRRQEAGGATRIVAPDGAVRRVLELTGVEATLGLDGSIDQALARF
jgi:stage II sporulation protein AA (anti-sigma F factor antagonist)